MSALETIKKFWEIQDKGDYTATSALFAADARFEDPMYGNFDGREAIAEFMAKMNQVMRERNTHFEVGRIEGDGEVAWAQWTAVTPNGNIEGCGLYRVTNGEISYYKDYMNAPSADGGE